MGLTFAEPVRIRASVAFFAAPGCNSRAIARLRRRNSARHTPTWADFRNCIRSSPRYGRYARSFPRLLITWFGVQAPVGHSNGAQGIMLSVTPAHRETLPKASCPNRAHRILQSAPRSVRFTQTCCALSHSRPVYPHTKPLFCVASLFPCRLGNRPHH